MPNEHIDLSKYQPDPLKSLEDIFSDSPSMSPNHPVIKGREYMGKLGENIANPSIDFEYGKDEFERRSKELADIITFGSPDSSPTQTPIYFDGVIFVKELFRTASIEELSSSTDDKPLYQIEIAYSQKNSIETGVFGGTYVDNLAYVHGDTGHKSYADAEKALRQDLFVKLK